MGIEERKIVMGRGLSKENQLLLKAYYLIFETEKMIKGKKLLAVRDKDFNKSELHWLLKAADYLQRNNQSVDQFVDALGCSKGVKRLVAEGWEALGEVEISFRSKWLRSEVGKKKKGKNYIGKGKAILRMPELGTYHEQIKKHYGMLGINTKPRFGKKKTKEQIHRNFQEYIQYLREIQEGGEVSKWLGVASTLFTALSGIRSLAHW